MKIFGNKEEFAITYIPDLKEDQDEEALIENPDEYILGGSVCFWVKGKNLFAFKDWGPDATYSYYNLYSLVYFLSTCLFDHITDILFPVKTKATNAQDMIDETSLIDSDVEDELEAYENLDWDNVDRDLIRKIDNWMSPRTFLRHRGGTFLPNIVVRRIGNKIEISWHNRHPHSDGENEFYFLHKRGVEHVDTKLYKDVVIEFCLAYADRIQEKEPEIAEKYRKNLQKAIELKC